MDDSTPLWIDAICISQTDNAEKALQIPRMGDIYRLANRVVAWLGEGGTTGEYAMKLRKSCGANARKLVRFVDLEKDPADPDITDPCHYLKMHYAAILSLLRRP